MVPSSCGVATVGLRVLLSLHPRPPPLPHPSLLPSPIPRSAPQPRRRWRGRCLELPHRRLLLHQSPKCCHKEADSRADLARGGGEVEEISRATMLWRAAKLPIYSVAIVPLTVGSTAAYLETGTFFVGRYLVLLAASVLVITWLNLSNDVFDFDTGADRNKKESVVNIFGSRTVALSIANGSLAFGVAGLIFAASKSGDIHVILLLLCAILCGYIYQCPPFRLSYSGLGEPLCFSAFGPFATVAFYLSQGSKSSTGKLPLLPITGTVLSASLLVGLTTTLILFCSHFHQIDGDRAIGKMSPLVRIGTKTGYEVVRAAVVMLYSLLFLFGLIKFLPLPSVILGALTLPVGKLVVDYVGKNHNYNLKIFMAKYYCVRLHSLFGVALACGLVLARKGSAASVTRLLAP